MKRIFLAGAGRSSAVLIKFLLSRSEATGFKLVVGDVTMEAAQAKTGAHPNSLAIAFDVLNDDQRATEVAGSDVVISLLPPHLHHLLVKECIRFKKHFISASYISSEVLAMNEAATNAGILVLGECGLDPGIDHMSAIDRKSTRLNSSHT